MTDSRFELEYLDVGARITMDDGHVNAMDNNWFESIQGLLAEVEASDAPCLIIRGNGKVFSGGLNIKWLPTMDRNELVGFFQLFSGTMKRIYYYPKPTIAQITGHGIAGGFILACACDRQVAIKDARLAMNEVRVNMTIPQWAIDIISDTVPKPYAKRLLKFGDPVTTNQLHEWGVVETLSDSQGELSEAALDVAKSIEGISAQHFSGTKKNVERLIRREG